MLVLVAFDELRRHLGDDLLAVEAGPAALQMDDAVDDTGGVAQRSLVLKHSAQQIAQLLLFRLDVGHQI